LVLIFSKASAHLAGERVTFLCPCKEKSPKENTLFCASEELLFKPEFARSLQVHRIGARTRVVVKQHRLYEATSYDPKFDNQ
jgi:hypothetical protein